MPTKTKLFLLINNYSTIKIQLNIFTNILKIKVMKSKNLLTLFALILLSTTTFAQRLVKDINTYTESSLKTHNSFVLGDEILFFADDGVHGTEIWKSDGTPAGTQMVKDAFPGKMGIDVSWVTDNPPVFFNNAYYFASYDENNVLRLWRTDGTEAGTGVFSPNITLNSSDFDGDYFLQVIGNELIFVGDDGTTGFEIYKTDGTEAGTVLVKDIVPGTDAPYIDSYYYTSTDNYVFFVAENENEMSRIWRTDGTEAGTFMVNNSDDTSYAEIYSLVAFNNEVYFYDDATSTFWKSDGTENGAVLLKNNLYFGVSEFGYDYFFYNNEMYFSGATNDFGSELWKTDGTVDGTVLVKDIVSGTSGSDPYEFEISNGRLYFNANNLLWKTDGTEAGTELVTSQFNEIDDLNDLNGSLTFCASDAGDRVMCITDGTEAGTTVLNTIEQSQSSMSPYLYNNEVYFIGFNTNTQSRALYKTNGTINGTLPVKDFSSISYFSHQNIANGKYYFSTNDYIHGKEMWISDGTQAGTFMLKDINKRSKSSSPRSITDVNGITYFSAVTPENGRELWKTDGTDAGTVMIKDINTTISSGDNANEDGILNDDEFINFNGTLFFPADDGTNGVELWKSDGTEAGTVMVKDINNNGNSIVDNFTVVGNKLYFTAYETTSGIELWVTDGTEAGTQMVGDIYQGAGSSNPCDFVVYNDEIYFSASDGTSTKFYKVNSTTGNVELVKDIITYEKIVYKGKIYMSAIGTSGIGKELFVSDGTSAGTVLLKDLSTYSGSPDFFTISNGLLYFRAGYIYNSDFTGLWKTDGTADGTVMVKQIIIFQLTEANGTLFMDVRDNYDQELWISDGTETGTVLLKNINPTSYSYIENMTNVNGILFFSAKNGPDGREFWMSDGTEAGTQMVMNINIEQAGSSSNYNYGADIKEIMFDGTNVYFNATSLEYGNELWTFNPNMEYAQITTNPEDVVICEGNNATYSITADNATSYQWQVDDGSGFADISGGIYSGETTYTLTITAPDASYNGYKYRCVATNTGGDATSLHAELFVNDVPTADAGEDADNLCGLTYSLTANALNSNETGTWEIVSGGTGSFDNQYSNTATFTADADGTYILSWFIDNGNCSSIDEVEITLAEDTENPTMNCIENTTVTANQYHVYVVNGTEFDPTNVTDNCGVASTLNDYNSTSTLANEQLPEGMNLITWTTIDNNGNSVECSFTITVNAYVGIADLSAKGISLYPNPTTGIFRLANVHALGNVKITDVTGKSIDNYQLSITNSTVDISNQPSGIYFIKIQTNKGVYTEKIIKQ